MSTTGTFREARRLARTYRRYAPFYDWLFAGLYRSARTRSIASLGLAPPDRVLIACIGTGLDLPELPPSLAAVGLDFSPAMLARTSNKPCASVVDLVLGDAQRVPFSSGAFDAAILHLALSVVPDPAAALREILRVVKPGGRIAVLDKFAPAGGVSRALRIVNAAARWTGTDITRRFDDIIDGQPVTVLSHRTALLGNYELILLQRGGTSVPCTGFVDGQTQSVSHW